MTTLREAAQQALEALENGKRVRAGEGGTKFQIPLEDNAITALRAALERQEEPVQEPVACCDLEERKALSSVKLPCDVRIGHGTHRKGSSLLALVVRSRSLYQMAKSDDYYGYASRLAVALWEKHYKDIAPQWKPLDDLMGVLTQIDNMTVGLTRQPEPVQEPVAWTLTKTLDKRETTTNGYLWFSDPVNSSWTPLYTAPPRRPNCASLEAQNTELDRRLAEMEQAYENGYKAGVAAEREECAKVCDFHVARLSAIDEPRPALAVGICAAAIRARGNT